MMLRLMEISTRARLITRLLFYEVDLSAGSQAGRITKQLNIQKPDWCRTWEEHYNKYTLLPFIS